MSTHPISILLIAVIGLCCVGYLVRTLLRIAWRELSAYMRNQRFGE